LGADKAALTDQVASLLQSLEHAGLVHTEADGTAAGGTAADGTAAEGGRLHLDPGLQHDFSLHHSLSLFLVEAIAQLDPASETFHLDIITWVEAILDNPMPVLVAQARRERGLVINELKARGVPYDERMDALEDVTWPRPFADQIFTFFNAYDEAHPWVSGESIRPKSVVRELVEGYRAFGDYVSELGIDRSEGVLLRYVTQAYKALVQNVPEPLHSDDFVDVLAYLRAMLARVDSSLVTEWEQLVLGGQAPSAEAPRPVDISLDRRAFRARIRAELHALVRALSQGDWDEAAACLSSDTPDRWSADDLSHALEPFILEHGPVAFDHRARLASHTRIDPAGPHQWTVRQALLPAMTGVYGDPDATGFEHLDPMFDEGAETVAWGLDARIDLREDTNPDGPLLRLLSIAE